MRPSPPFHSQSLALGVTLTAVLVAAFFAFVGVSAFVPALLARPIAAEGTVTWAFACGLGVIALGVLLTGLYVVVANRAETRRTGA